MKNQATFQKYELPAFFLLAYLLSWWSIPLAGGGIIPHGPALTAVILTALTAGKQGLHELWKRCTNFRAGGWYFIGPIIVAVYLFAAFIVNILMGATAVSPFPFPSPVTMIILLLMGGLLEEPGWTGYALPKLQEQFALHPYGMLASTLTVGFFRAIWHMPLVISGAIAWYDAVFFIAAFQIIISWLYNQTKGNIPAVMFFHYSSNLLTGSMMLQAFSGSEQTTYYILFVVFACLTAVTILWKTKLHPGRD